LSPAFITKPTTSIALSLLVGRAAYFDVWDANNKGYQRKDRLVTDTNIATALPWILISLNQNIFDNLLIPISLGSSILCLFFIIFIFRDLRDKDTRLISQMQILIGIGVLLVLKKETGEPKSKEHSSR
jgi:predicted permease